MRVTQNNITRQYMHNNNAALDNMNKINTKILSQRKFMRASEDPVSAAKALVIRRSLANNDIYKANLDTADGIYSSAEKSLLSISSVSTTVTDSIIQGANGSQGPDEKKIVAGQIRNMAKEMMTQINSEYAGRKLFGGTNNSTIPYVYDEATKVLTYNGTDITTNDINLYPQNKEISVDVGFGMKFDAAGNVDKQSVMNIALSGAEVLGYGTDADGDPKNLIALAYRAADALDANDSDKAMAILEKINDSKSNLMASITNLGNQQQTVDYARDRVQNDVLSLKVAQNETEGINLAEEITNFKTAEMAYNATLSMGGKVIPKSIFDFI